MSGGPQHAGRQLPQASYGNDPPHRRMHSLGLSTASLDPESHPNTAVAASPGMGWTPSKGDLSLADTSFLAPSPPEFRGQGAQESNQLPGSVPVLAACRCPQSSLPLPREGQVPTCLTLGPHKALGTVASEGPGEVPAGPAVLTGL